MPRQPVADLLTREETLRALRAQQKKAKHPIRWVDLPHVVRLAVRAHFQRFENARRAAHLPPLPRTRKWSAELVVRELRRVSRQGVVPNAPGLAKAGRRDLIHAISLHIGSLVRARALAGLRQPERVWTESESWDEDRILSDILDRAEQGLSLAYSRVEQRLLDAARRYFGSWKAAIEAAGLDYDRIRLQRPDYTGDELCDLLRALAKRHPNLTVSELHAMGCSGALMRVFGSIELAAREAGLRGWPRRRSFRPMSRSRVIARLRSRGLKGKPVYAHAVLEEDPRVWRSGIAHWGRWPRMLLAAGLQRSLPKQRIWSRALVLERLRARQRRGLSVRPTHVLKSDVSLFVQATKFFGSYRLAARRIGVDTGVRHWTKTMLIRELRRVAGRRRLLTISQVRPAVYGAAQKLFGRFSAACGAAGLEVHTNKLAGRLHSRRELGATKAGLR